MRHLLYYFITVINIEFNVFYISNSLEAVSVNDEKNSQSLYFEAAFYIIRRISVTAEVQKLHKKKLS